MDFPQVIQVFKFSKNKNHYVSPHKHENTEYVFYINGNGRTIIGNNEYTFSKESVAVINPNTVHDERHFTEGELICFITSGISSEISNGVYTPQNFIELKKTIMNMYLQSRSPKFGHSRIMSSYAEQVRLLLIRDLISQKVNSSALEKIMNRLKNECNFTDSAQFSKMFKAQYGISQNEYRRSYNN